MSVDGQDGEPVSVTTGLPQGSPISPALFALYIADIHGAVDDQVEDSRGICYVDDVTWIFEGTDVEDVASKLERCATSSLQWADRNAVRLEESKTEAIHFSRRRNHKRCRREIRVGTTHRVRFNPAATRWLGIWLDASLNLAENRRRKIGKTRQAEARLRRIVNQYGVPPAAARNLQAAIVQGTMLYASEPTWNGRGNVEREYQPAINRISRAVLGAFQTTPRGAIMAGGGFAPAGALSGHRRARFAQRHFAGPKERERPKEILGRNSTLTARLGRAAISREGTAEGQQWSEARRFPGQVIVEEREPLRTASEWSRPDTIWTDGSRQDNGMVEWHASGGPRRGGPDADSIWAPTRRSSTRRPLPSTRPSGPSTRNRRTAGDTRSLSTRPPPSLG